MLGGGWTPLSPPEYITLNPSLIKSPVSFHLTSDSPSMFSFAFLISPITPASFPGLLNVLTFQVPILISFAFLSCLLSSSSFCCCCLCCRCCCCCSCCCCCCCLCFCWCLQGFRLLTTLEALFPPLPNATLSSCWADSFTMFTGILFDDIFHITWEE